MLLLSFKKRLDMLRNLLAYVSVGLLTRVLRSPAISNLHEVIASCSSKIGNSLRKSFSFRPFSLDGGGL